MTGIRKRNKKNRRMLRKKINWKNKDFFHEREGTERNNKRNLGGKKEMKTMEAKKRWKYLI